MIQLLLEIIQADGTLIVTRTDDCFIQVHYDNRLDYGQDVQTYTVDDVTITILKGAGDISETLAVFAYNKENVISVEDNTTGVICIPYYEGA